MNNSFRNPLNFTNLSLWAALFLSAFNAHSLNLSKIVKDGDIILQRSQSQQSQAIAEATHSQFTHVGIVFFKQGIPYVFEAHNAVASRSLSAWLSAGYQSKYVVKRLRNANILLTNAALARLRSVANTFAGKPYDIYFGWSDDRIYCSELVWKIFDRALHLSVGRTEHLRDFDLSSPAVQKVLKERYGNNIPYGEVVVSPAAIANSTNLETIAANWFN